MEIAIHLSVWGLHKDYGQTLWVFPTDKQRDLQVALLKKKKKYLILFISLNLKILDIILSEDIVKSEGGQS